MINGEKEYTKGGATKAASLETVAEWIDQSWNKVPSNMVEYSFKKCCISNATGRKQMERKTYMMTD